MINNFKLYFILTNLSTSIRLQQNPLVTYIPPAGNVHTAASNVMLTADNVLLI